MWEGGRQLLFDGAMGTYYAERFSASSSKCELANLAHPDAILNIHREYRSAGAGAIRTNTFGANTALLETGFDEVERVIAAGWRLARQAAEGSATVYADIGPIPGGNTPEAESEYARIADVFLACGADRFVFETFGEQQSVLRAARHIKARNPRAIVLAQFAVTPDGFTRVGVPGHEIKRAMEESPFIDAWGFNCLSGPSYLLKYIAGLGHSAKPMSAMPNAGYPLLEGGRTVYANHPEYFADKLMELRALGITILGGCCGTAPRHIARLAQLLQAGTYGSPHPAHIRQKKETGTAAQNHFWGRLQRGEKVVAVEVDPPRDAAAESMLEGAARVRCAGADIITVADNPLARVRADSSMTASLIRRRCGCCVMPHIACRDRNLNAIKSLLLGLHIEGIRNVLVVTGDPIAQADRGEVKGVYNSNSAVLAGYIRSLNESVFAGDPFIVGAALNIHAPNLDAELARAQYKARCGVGFFMTQPAFGEKAAEALKQARAALDARLIAGLLPLAGYRNALFIQNEVPGIDIPQGVVERFHGLDRAQSERLGLALAQQTAREILPWVDGYHVITPLLRFGMVEKLVTALWREIDETNR